MTELLMDHLSPSYYVNTVYHTSYKVKLRLQKELDGHSAIRTRVSRRFNPGSATDRC